MQDLLEAFPDGWVSEKEQKALPTLAKEPSKSLPVAVHPDPVDQLLVDFLLPTFPEKVNANGEAEAEGYVFPDLAGWRWQELAGEGNRLGNDIGAPSHPPAAGVSRETAGLEDLLIDFDNALDLASPADAQAKITPVMHSSTTATSYSARPTSDSSELSSPTRVNSSPSTRTALTSTSPNHVTYNYLLRSATSASSQAPIKTPAAPSHVKEVVRARDAPPAAVASPSPTRSISIAGRAQRDRERRHAAEDTSPPPHYNAAPFKRFIEARQPSDEKNDEWKDEDSDLVSQRQGWRTANLPRSPDTPAEINDASHSESPSTSRPHSSSTFKRGASSDRPPSQESPSPASPDASDAVPAELHLPPVEGVETGWRAAPHAGVKAPSREPNGANRSRHDSPSEPSHWVDESQESSRGGLYGMGIRGRARGPGGGTMRDSYRPDYDANPRASYQPRRPNDSDSAPKPFTARIVYPQHTQRFERKKDGSDDDTEAGDDDSSDGSWIKRRGEPDWSRNEWNDSWEMQRQGISGRFNKRNREIPNAW